MGYAYLADLVVAVHLAFVAFVVVGELVILIGRLCRWEGVRNFWFRSAHLLAIGVVAFEALSNIPCPLTTWEYDLREAAGQRVDRGTTFIGKVARDVLFYRPENPATIERLHIAFGALVLATYVFIPPRWPRRRADRAAGAAPGGAAGPPPAQSPISR
jgi:hypothetical protein